MILKHISEMLCLLISYSKFTRPRELTECTLLTNCVKIELPGDSRGLQKPDRKQKECRGQKQDGKSR